MKTASEEVADMIFANKWSSQTLCAGGELGVFDLLSSVNARAASNVAADLRVDPKLLLPSCPSVALSGRVAGGHLPRAKALGCSLCPLRVQTDQSLFTFHLSLLTSHLSQKSQSPVGTIPALSTIRITVRSGERVRCKTPLGTTNPCLGLSPTVRPSRSMVSSPSTT